MAVRLVPANPDPAEFPFVPFACDLRPALCGGCTLASCPFYPPEGELVSPLLVEGLFHEEEDP